MRFSCIRSSPNRGSAHDRASVQKVSREAKSKRAFSAMLPIERAALVRQFAQLSCATVAHKCTDSPARRDVRMSMDFVRDGGHFCAASNFMH